MTRDQDEHGPRWYEGYQLGLRDALTGGITCICGGGPETLEMAEGYWAGREAAPAGSRARGGLVMTGPEDIAPGMDWPTLAAPIAAIQQGRPEAAPTRPDPHEADWAGTGFSRPGPAEHSPASRELFWAALEDALMSTADQDSCDGCQGARPCETHTSRAARAEQYKQALKQEMEAGP